MHVQNQSAAQGTAFAISYESELERVTLENLVVFSVAEHTPWKRLATYEVPGDLPACPEGGCTCAWLWVPKGCGQPNVYMQGFKCAVTGSASTKKVASAKAPVYCEGEEEKCVNGAKQIIVWNQKEPGLIMLLGVPDEFLAAPGYNSRCGFSAGAQENIFENGEDGNTPTFSASVSTSTLVSTPAATGSTEVSILPVTDVGITATPSQVTHVADVSTSYSTSCREVLVTGASSQNPPPLATGTSPPISFTSTWTGRTGKPTKFTCYADA